MHQPIRDNLEEYLKGFGERKAPPEFTAHLASCRQCSDELLMMDRQTRLLRSLSAGEEMDPRPGFYARVMERIEAQTDSSIWSVFLQPAFARRLAVASATLALLLGTYLIGTEPGEQPGPAAVVATQSVPFADDAQHVDQQRDAVLVNLASYHGE